LAAQCSETVYVIVIRAPLLLQDIYETTHRDSPHRDLRRLVWDARHLWAFSLCRRPGHIYHAISPFRISCVADGSHPDCTQRDISPRKSPLAVDRDGGSGLGW